jgi:hypothetical protein
MVSEPLLPASHNGFVFLCAYAHVSAVVLIQALFVKSSQKLLTLALQAALYALREKKAH